MVKRLENIVASVLNDKAINEDTDPCGIRRPANLLPHHVARKTSVGAKGSGSHQTTTASPKHLQRARHG